MCMRERKRGGLAQAQVVNSYKPMPSESKFVIGVKEKGNGSCLFLDPLKPQPD